MEDSQGSGFGTKGGVLFFFLYIPLVFAGGSDGWLVGGGIGKLDLEFFRCFFSFLFLLSCALGGCLRWVGSLYLGT